jgi:hypothetical protein
MAGDDRRTPGGQVGLSSQIEIEGLEPPRRPQQEWGGIVPVVRDRGDVAAEQVCLGAPELVERAGLGRADELESRIESAGLEARQRGGQRAFRTPGGVRRQRDGALQQCRRSGQSASRSRPRRRVLELRGHRLVGFRRCRGQMPRPTVGIGVAVGYLRQRQMHRPATLDRSRAIDR